MKINKIKRNEFKSKWDKKFRLDIKKIKTLKYIIYILELENI